MAQLKLRITIGDQDHVVGVIPFDYVAFEKQHGVTWGSIQADPPMEHLLWISWHAAKRKGVTDLDFAAFLEAVEGWEQAAADPLASGSSEPSGSGS